MLIHDDTFAWEGFGGLFKLAAGKCRLRIFDLAKSDRRKIVHLKPFIVIASDLPDDSPKVKKITVRSCAGHIATQVVRQFHIDPHRMIFVEYYPASTYGDRNQHRIAAKFEVVEFDWHGGKALHPAWHSLEEPLLSEVAERISQTE